ncbi:MAG: helicase, partial [Mycobacterium sp.]|nr:helicase [Mycobacterium sp.]
AAFTILHRRLTHLDDGAGTTVITRYTLRLLTVQQFQRAATMIMACERIRQGRPGELGSIPISIGVWVGGSNTPNNYAQAVRLRRDLERGLKPTESFQVDQCPWCGTSLIPRGEADPRWGITATNSSIRFHCVNERCDFYSGIPISSVDEDLYAHPPTLLVGTVDKFARLAWDERAGVFFGAGDLPGPSLMIQDEFHLISGPLGTIVGLYEAAFDVLMQHHGASPKIVAATATIRRAGEQSRGVFGRDVALFPPSGLDAGSSYFVRTDASLPGREYVGVMPQGHTHVTALVHLAAALLQAPRDVELSDAVLDGYWTLVAYHNSLRELGKTVTLAHDDFRSRMETIARTSDRVRPIDDVRELTSRVQAVEIPRVLERLGRSYGKHGVVSLVAATNMISVGVDVERLGLMVVDGQPKTTAEYIQATSRVGRKSMKHPGLVVTLYSPTKPRDRSHYESFVPYHSMLYSAIEPTSVTPFSVMARSRALHADLVVLARHALGLGDNADAGKFDETDEELNALLAQLIERAARADATEIPGVRRHLRRLLREWTRSAVSAETRGGLLYEGSERQARLLKRFLETGDAWETLDSMRSVDIEVPVRVRGAD